MVKYKYAGRKSLQNLARDQQSACPCRSLAWPSRARLCLDFAKLSTSTYSTVRVCIPTTYPVYSYVLDSSKIYSYVRRLIVYSITHAVVTVVNVIFPVYGNKC